jgi:hypothetical protein
MTIFTGAGMKQQRVADAMNPAWYPTGRSFLRACEFGVFRSLNDCEFLDFLAELRNVLWSRPLEVSKKT